MRHYRERGTGQVLVARKAINSVVLPPLELPPMELPEPEHATLIRDSKLLGKILVTKTKSSSDVVTIGRNTDIRSPEASSNGNLKLNGNCGANGGTAAVTMPVSSPAAGPPATDGRVAQLEQNIKYLQEQHQLMLTGLHHEIDCLRHRNRELQFQLVFAKGTNVSTPSSPEDEKQKLYSSSPKALNITPLQVEILEKELGEMKIQLQESECRNVYLSAIVDEQKKKLERYERDRERERERGIQPDPELLRKLDDAETLIRRLRRDNSDLRRENAAAAAAVGANATAYQPQQQQQQRHYHHTSRNSGQRRRGGNGGGGGGDGGGSAGSNNTSTAGNATSGGGGGQQVASAPNMSNTTSGGGSQAYRPNWFPPLHTQNYWQQQSRPQPSHVDALPQLQTATGHHVVYQPHQQQVHQGHGRRGGGGGGGNNNHYQHTTGERKYRGNNHQNRGQKSS